MARVNGKNLSLTFGSLDVKCEATSIVLDNEPADADLVTFADVIAGTDVRWFFAIAAYTDLGAGSWWELLWSTPAFTELPYLFKPYGNATATTAQPHFSGVVTVDRKPPVGDDAAKTWAFDARLTCTAAPVRVVA